MKQAPMAGLVLLCSHIFICVVFGTACSGKTIVDPDIDAGSGGTTASSSGTTSSSGCGTQDCGGSPSECRCTAVCPGGEYSVECQLGSPNHTCECFIDGVSDGVGVLTKDPEPCHIFTGPCASTFFP